MTGFQVDNKCKFNRADNFYHQSHHLYYVDKKPQPPSTATVWFNRPTTTYNSVSLLTNLKSTTVKPQNSPTKCDDNDASNSNGLPSAEQLHYVFDKLGESVSIYSKILNTCTYIIYHDICTFMQFNNYFSCPHCLSKIWTILCFIPN